MLIGELARRIGRTPETIKRWADEGLIPCDRDERNRRVFREDHVSLCLELVRLSVTAQISNTKLSEILERRPKQLPLIGS